MSLVRALPVFCYGLFTLAVQALLFREFLTSFEGSDISVGLFFGAWFVWIAAGTCLTRRATPLAGRLLRRMEYVLLAYVPAVALQWFLIVHARDLVGASAYLLLPMRTVIPLALIVNAPVGLLTGLLFPLLCRWTRGVDEQSPVAQVYRLEALGSLVGGAGTTLLLGGGWPPLRVLLLPATLIALAASAVRWNHTRKWNWLVLPGLLLVTLLAGGDRPLTRRLQQGKWDRLLPGTFFGGSFQTPQAEYLHGTVREQWVVLRDGATCEALPDGANGRMAALALCQRPQASEILVVGSGLGLCQKFLALDSVRQVTWAQGDGDYMRRLVERAPPEYRHDDDRLRLLGGDLRARLASEGVRYDLVVLNLPAPTSSVLNRFHTLEAYKLIRQAMLPGGVFAIAVGGAANRMGEEQLLLGASMRATLLQVFPDLVLASGEGTWLLAANPGILSDDPEILQDRLASVPGADNLFPPAALHTVYQPDRAAAVLERYARAPLTDSLLINCDARPLATRYSLMLTARQAGMRGVEFYSRLMRSGPLALLAPFLALVLMRLVSVSLAPYRVRDPASAATWLAGTAGAAGIGISIILMHAYQTRHGALYLHVGLLSALYMAGLAAGAATTTSLLARHPSAGLEPRGTGRLPDGTAGPRLGLLIAHVGLLALVAFWPQQGWRPVVYAVVFLLCGLCAGGYFPLSAGLLAGAGIETGRAAGRVESADHLGAATGSLMTGLLMLPLLGVRATLLALALLLLSNLPMPALRRATADTPEMSKASAWKWLRPLGYLLLGVALTVAIGHRHWAKPLPAVPSALPLDAFPLSATLSGGPPPAHEHAPLPAAPPAPESDAPSSDGLHLLRSLIREGRLSDHEADFYRAVPSGR